MERYQKKENQEKRPSSHQRAPCDKCLASAISTFEKTLPTVCGVISRVLFCSHSSRVFAPEVGSTDAEFAKRVAAGSGAC